MARPKKPQLIILLPLKIERSFSENPIVAMFELEGILFMGLNGGPMFKINPSISFFVFCDSEEDIEKKWKVLSEGGGVMMPLDKYPWNDKYGWCSDKYGVNWQLMLGADAKQKIVSFIYVYAAAKRQGRRSDKLLHFSI